MPILRLVLALSCATIVLGGCQASDTIEITDPEQLSRVIAQRDKPVLVDFYKWGCPTCVALDPGYDMLAKEYKGRVAVVRYLHMYPWFQYNSLDLQFKYWIAFVPTVILFVNGEERQRWVSWYYLPHYREAMDKALAEMDAARRKGAAAQARIQGGP